MEEKLEKGKFVRRRIKRHLETRVSIEGRRSTHCFRRCATLLEDVALLTPLRATMTWVRGDPPTCDGRSHPQTLDRELCTQIRRAAPPTKINLLPANVANWPPWLAVSFAPGHRSIDDRLTCFGLWRGSSFTFCSSKKFRWKTTLRTFCIDSSSDHSLYIYIWI